MTEINGESIDWALQLCELCFVGSIIWKPCAVLIYLAASERRYFNSCSLEHSIYVKGCWIRDLSGDFTEP